tara:strand:- start:3722 stop:4663 length:942 start_codon:yes stop_codon:yes gene_type:complete
MNFKDFSKIRVLVVGDLMIDDYTFGKSNRMSPEAPVPVIIPEDRKFIAGGAGNVIENLYEMSANVSYLGAVGDDDGGKRLKLILDRKTSNNLLFENKSKTTEKKRIYLNDKQILRIDIEEIEDLKISSNFKRFIKNINQFDVVILSDYNKGVLNSETIPYIIKECNIPIIVDPKKENFSVYKNATILTPNIEELNNASNMLVEDDSSVVAASKKLIENFGFKYIVTTKGDKGLTIVANNYVQHIKSDFIKNPDVTGAGDTVISALSLAYHATKDILLSAQFANYAAYLSVSKKGTASNSIEELRMFKGANEVK